MGERKNFLGVLYALLLVLCAGIIGYMLIEKWPLLDAFYMTIITISTVGYGEVRPLSSAGRIFSSFLIVGGVGVALYALTTTVEYFVRGHITNMFGSRRMRERISRLKGHYILCGYGRVGRVVAQAFKSEGTGFVVIDPNPEAISQATADGCLCLQGDASAYDVLRSAGIERARGLVAVTGDDATNVFIIVSARKLAQDLFVVARASSEDSKAKLEAVGANRAVDPYHSGGERMARLALYPVVSDFIEKVLPGYGKELGLEDIEVTPVSLLRGKSIGEAQEYSGGASILAIRKPGGDTMPKPPDDTIIEVGDRLVILGTREQLRVLEGTT